MEKNTKFITREVKEQYRKLSANTAEYFECQLPILAESEKAVCFDASQSHLSTNHKGVWLPKSQMIILDMGEDSNFRYFVKNWLYAKIK